MIYTAGIFVLNIKQEILLVHPTNAPSNNWSIPKGLINDNEVVIDAAKRELFEETNVDLDKLKTDFIYVGKNVIYKSRKKTLCPVFTKVNMEINDVIFKCNSLVDNQSFYENDAIEWFKIKKAKTLIHETQVVALEVMLYDLFGTTN